MSNQKIVFASILGAILATGLLALNPSMIGNAQAQMYSNDYGYDNNYYQDDNRYSYDKKDSKSSHVDIQKIKCVNSNINVNGVDITEIPQDNTALGAANEGGEDATGAQSGNGWGDRINFERNLVNICVNVNANEQVKGTPPEEEPRPCEECFTNELDENQLEDLFPIQTPGDPIPTLEDLCNYLESITSTEEKQLAYVIVFSGLDDTPSISDDERDAIIDCLLDLGLIVQPPP